jgi:2-keto-3-deoxy-L-rhamnonate aldolase RhmA
MPTSWAASWTDPPAATKAASTSIHRIVANGTVDGTAVGPADVAVTVVPRNEEQEEFARAVAQLPPTRDFIRDVED